MCPECKAPVGRIELLTVTVSWFHCPACQHRWVAEEPRPAPKH